MLLDSLVNFLNILPPDISSHLDIRSSVVGDATDMRKPVLPSVRVPSEERGGSIAMDLASS